MKLASIISAWDGIEILPYAIRSTSPGVDLFIIVYQVESNFGELYNPLPEIRSTISQFPDKNFILSCYTPPFKTGFVNETEKRNIGLRIAREHNCTHFFFQDTDECYKNFPAAKREYIASGSSGSVCRLFTYFKLPTLRLEAHDNYYVPFIHTLNSDTVAGYPEYPFYVDPTRKVNCKNVTLINEPMHHFSYVRMDIERKCRNSSARDNIAKSQLLQDYHNHEVGEGFYVTDFRQKLVLVENYFNIEV